MHIEIPDTLLDDPDKLAVHLSLKLSRPCVILTAANSERASRVTQAVTALYSLSMSVPRVVNFVIAGLDDRDFTKSFGILLDVPETASLPFPPGSDGDEIESAIDDPGVRV